MNQEFPAKTVEGQANAAEPGEQDVWSGVRWNAFTAYATRGVKAVVGLVLLRLLEPEDYGLIGMAMVVVGFLGVFQRLGFSQAIIQRKKIDQSVLAGAFFLGMTFSVFLSGGLALSSPLIERAYGNDQVGEVAAVLGLGFVISALGLIPSTLLRRKMRFDKLAVAGLVSTVLGGIVSLVMAATGWGVWALVAGTLVAPGISVVITWFMQPWKPTFVVRWSETKGLLHFGGFLTAFQTVTHVARNADAFLIGAHLGGRALGFYRVGYGLMLLPRQLITSVAAAVLFPMFARIQDDDQQLGQHYIRTSSITAFLSFPLLTGLLVLAEPFVHVVYGAKWLPAVPIVMLFAPVGMLQSLGSSIGLLYQAKGRTDLQFYWGTLWASIQVASFVVGLPWGITGVATAYAVANALIFVPTQWAAFRVVKGLYVTDWLRPIFRHGANCLAMAVVTLLCRSQLEQAGAHVAIVLAVSVVVGAITYGLLVYWRPPPALFDVLRLGRMSNLRWLPRRLRPE